MVTCLTFFRQRNQTAKTHCACIRHRCRNGVLPSVAGTILLCSGLVFVFSSVICAAPPVQNDVKTAVFSPQQRFGELFVLGMIYLQPGGGTLTYPDRRPQVVRPRREIRAPIGSIISTCATETARLRFECGSRLDLGPNSRVVLRTWHIDLQKGPCLLRHVGSPLSLKVGGVATFTIRPETMAEITRDGDTVLARVQTGRVRAAGLGDELTPGDNAVALAGAVSRTDTVAPLCSWWQPAPVAAEGWSVPEPEVLLESSIDFTDAADETEIDGSYNGYPENGQEQNPIEQLFQHDPNLPPEENEGGKYDGF